QPNVHPVRFLIACRGGHLDDFPWVTYVHKGTPCTAPMLTLRQYGASGEASDVVVRCTACNTERRMGEAFGEDAWAPLMTCRGHRPHLRDVDEQECKQPLKTILLGAS